MARTTDGADPLPQLSKRERLIAAKFAEGLTYREISRALHIAPTTVRTHIATIYRKLGISNKAALVRMFAGGQSGNGRTTLETTPGERQCAGPHGAPRGGSSAGLRAPIGVRPRIRLLQGSIPEQAALPAVAVLPFETWEGEPNQTRLAGQLTEDIKAALARFDWLRVVPASNSSFAESKLPNARTVALARGVHYLVTGCLWQADDRVRWTFRLLVPNTGKFIWAEQYDNDLSKALAARDEIAQKTASIFAYRLKTERAARLIPALVEDMNVNDWVLLGETIAGVTIDGNHLARQAYRTALDLDPNCAMAHAGLAHSHVIDSIFWHSDDVEFSLELARYYAEKGANLNHTNSKPEWVLGHVFAEMKDPRRAEKHFEGAIKLNPLDADAYVMNAVYLTQAGRYLEGMSLCEHALKLNPTQPGWYLSVLGNCLFHLGRYHEAVRYMRCFYDKWPAFRPAQLGLAACYAELGEYGEARNLVDKVLALAPDTSLGQELKVLSRRYGNAHMERRLKALRKAGVPE